jgi:tRNA threonylcarbamoyladenosine biosynthesis protein TsaB
MNIIAYETSTDAFSIGLQYKSIIRQERDCFPRQHAQIILTHTAKFLQEAKLSLACLHAITYSAGPGSFTGIRIGASVAQAMALSSGVPLLAIPSMQVAAQGAYRKRGSHKVRIILDARRDQVYYGLYSLNSHIMIPDQAARLGYWSELDLTTMAEDEVILSDFGEKIRQWLPGTVEVGEYSPEAVDLLPLAQEKIDRGHITSLEEALPLYFHTESAWQKKN